MTPEKAIIREVGKVFPDNGRNLKALTTMVCQHCRIVPLKHLEKHKHTHTQLDIQWYLLP